MFKKSLKWLYISLFTINSPFKMALASSLGLFLGMLPLLGIRLPIIFVLSLIFRLNIVASLLGLSITITFPILHLLSSWLGQYLAGFEVPFFSLRFQSFSYLLQWTTNGKYYLLGSTIVGFLISLAALPIFRWIYGWKIIKNRDEIRKAFVFYDHSGKRWSTLKRIGILFGLVVFIVVSVFGVSVSISPFLPTFGLKSINALATIKPITEKSLISRIKKMRKSKNNLWKSFKGKDLQQTNSKKVYGFFVSWDENSLSSLKRNINSLNYVVPDWYHLKPDMTLDNNIQPKVDELARVSGVKEIPLINNFIDNKWNEENVHKMLISPQLRSKVIQEMHEQVKHYGYAGVNIDFEGIKAEDKGLLTAFMTELYKVFHADGLLVTQDVPAQDDAFDYGALSKVSDNLIVMMYDEHFQGGKSGPIASDDWVQQSLGDLDIPDDKLIVSLGNYGYDWIENSDQPAEVVTFDDIMEMAKQYGLTINWDDNNNNPYLEYQEGDDHHIVWFLDGSTFYNQMKTSIGNGAGGFAIWRLGSEDPTVWNLLKYPDQIAQHVQELKSIINFNPVHYTGEGEILHIVSAAQYGDRSLEIDKDGFISGETYNSYPSQFEIERFGKPKDKEVALTFDDGPDPLYTPQILDILDKYKIKATFFIIGQNAEVNPDIVERIYKEGDEIGNHTFTHPNVADISPVRTRVELNLTQRLIEELTGHSVTMFRAPYVADAEPSSPNELLPILRAQEMGYTMIGELIDPLDWQTPPTDEIVKRVTDGLADGNIILLHDAGGDRSNTVKALPKIIESLQNRGYTFVTVGHLWGKNRNEVMPPVQVSENPFIEYDKAVFTTLANLHFAIAGFFYLAIGIGIFRFIFLIILSIKQKRKYKSQIIDKNYRPFVSVVIAAYNEEKVICKTVGSILQNDYEKFEVIIVNDGSTDETSKVIQKTFGKDKRVQLINKLNGGKASAINVGFKKSNGEIVVALDADTVIAPNAISLMVGHFTDERVAAVSGNVKVGNLKNLLTTWQYIEYIIGFNLERRAFAELNCITVVPGAIGAWRKEAVVAAGFFKDDTLAEDTDITLTLLKMGYKITYEEKAYAYTESPEDIKSLVKQRYRWSYGTLQCLWKHRDSLFNLKQKSLGFVALPNMWLFQYVFQAISPVTDIYFILGLFGNSPKKAAWFYIAFLVIDLIASLYAFRLEKENPKPLVWFLLQRVIYRQIMTYVVIKSIISVFKGVMVEWNKLQRKGNVALDNS